MQRLAHWADELVACDDDLLPDDLFDRIVALGDRSRERLLEFATDPAWRGPAADGGGLAPVHALEILAALAPDPATAARLVESILADPDAPEVDDVVECLIAAGSEATPHVLAALAESANPAAARALCETLALGGARDETAFAALTAAFERFPGDVAASLADYGDARAVPALRAALDARFVGAGSSADSDEDVLAIAQAIEDLGEDLGSEERRKRDLADRRQERRLSREEAREVAHGEPEAGPGATTAQAARPNDPCPCGSGRKYKKCHEGEPG